VDQFGLTYWKTDTLTYW